MTHKNKIATLLALPKLVSFYTVFVAIVLGLHGLVRLIRETRYIDIDQYWPVSHVLPRYPWWQELLILVGILLVFNQLLAWYREQRPMSHLLGLALVLVIATNGLLGVNEGLIKVVSGQGNSYWDDVESMTSVSELLQYYTTLQPTLHLHSRVHPPGPMLMIYGLREMVDDPLFVGFFMTLVGIAGAWFLYKLLLDEGVAPAYARLAGLLLVLLPASQIYYWSTVDAVIATLMIGSFYAWQQANLHKGAWWIVLLASMTALASLTFAVVFIGPVLVFDDWRRNGGVQRILKVLLGLVVIMISIQLLTGYDYYASFQIAKSYEGPAGTYALVDPWSYAVTRVEDMLEVLIFFTPILTVMFGIAVKTLWSKRAYGRFEMVGLVGMLSLAAFFVAGGYYTGETARAALYVYAYLLIPVTYILSQYKIAPRLSGRLLCLVFGQTLLMQLFGWYAW